MGQAGSHRDSHRAAHEDISDIAAMLALAEVIRAESSIPPKDTPMQLPTNDLNRFPAELVFNIARYLPRVSIGFLSTACKVLRQLLDASLKEIFSQLEEPCIVDGMNKSQKKSQKLEGIEELVEDGLYGPWKSKSVCMSCVTAHDSSAFSTESISPDQYHGHDVLWAECEASLPRAWICPHILVDYQSVHKLDFSTSDITTQWRAEDIRNLLPTMTPSEAGTIRCSVYRIPVSMEIKGETRVGLRVARVEFRQDLSNGFLSEKRVAYDLNRLRAPICPHIHLHHSIVKTAYSEKCKRLEAAAAGEPFRNCFCEICLAEERECKVCHARFHMDLSLDGNDWRMLYVIVTRNIKTGSSMTDPVWVAQTIPEEGFGRLHDIWANKTGRWCDWRKDCMRCKERK